MAEVIKRRTLRLSPKTGGGETRGTPIGDTLARMDGVRSVSMDNDVMHVEYDLLKLRLSDIQAAMEQSGYALANTLPARWKRAIVKTLEQNEYDNMTQQASPCCSNPRGIVDAAKKRDS